jgi:hypothetical protein
MVKKYTACLPRGRCLKTLLAAHDAFMAAIFMEMDYFKDICICGCISETTQK